MKTHIVPVLCAGLILLLCSCGAGPDAPTQAETGGKPLEITSFYFSHTASSTDGCWCLQLTLEESGTHLHAEELFFGGRIVDTMIEDNVLEQLGEVMGAYHVDRWDGFDKKNKHVMDGSNSFPENYSDVSSAILNLYYELMEQYAPSEDALQTEGSEAQ